MNTPNIIRDAIEAASARQYVSSAEREAEVATLEFALSLFEDMGGRVDCIPMRVKQFMDEHYSNELVCWNGAYRALATVVTALHCDGF